VRGSALAAEVARGQRVQATAETVGIGLATGCGRLGDVTPGSEAGSGLRDRNSRLPVVAVGARADTTGRTKARAAKNFMVKEKVTVGTVGGINEGGEVFQVEGQGQGLTSLALTRLMYERAHAGPHGGRRSHTVTKAVDATMICHVPDDSAATARCWRA
jgi:hypothetical protein